MPNIDLRTIKNIGIPKNNSVVNSVTNNGMDNINSVTNNGMDNTNNGMGIPSLQDIINNNSNNTTKTANNDIKPLDLIKISDKKEEVKLTETERNKIIAVLQLYVNEFEKLSKYRNRDFSKCKDSELIRFKEEFHREVTTTNSLGMVVSSSKKALELYEYISCNFLDLDIKGVSKISDSDEFQDCVKAIALKHIDSLTIQTEPEYKLMFLLLSNSLMMHQINTMNKVNNKEESINNITNKENPKENIDININLDENNEIMERLKANMNNINNNDEFDDL